MRRVFGWLLLVLGVLVAAPAAAAAVYVGPDDTAQTGPHDLRSSGVAIATEAEVLRYVGPVLHVRVERADGGPVFIGVAHEIDAGSYLAASGRRMISHVALPWTLQTEELPGAADPVPAPADQPWWITSVTGDGAQDLVWPIQNGRYSIVALNADGSARVEAKVTMGLELDGTFYTILAVATFGLLLILLGLALLLWRRRRTTPETATDAPSDPSRPYAAVDQ